MPSEVVLTSTTDSEQDMARALGVEPPKAEAPATPATPAAPVAAATPATPEAKAPETAPEPVAEGGDPNDSGDPPSAEGQSGAEAAPVDGTQPKKPTRYRPSANDRIQELTEERTTLARQLADERRGRSDVTRQLEALQREIDSLKRGTGSTPPPAEPDRPQGTTQAAADDDIDVPVTRPKPKHDDAKYDGDYDAFQDDLVQWGIEQAEARGVAKAERKFKQMLEDQRKQEQEQARQQYYMNLDEQARKSYPDYDEVIAASQNLEMSDGMIQAVFESPLFGHIKYFLAKNPHHVARIKAMSDVRGAQEIGRIERFIYDAMTERSGGDKPPADAKPATPAPQPRRQSSAPPPPATVGSGGGTGVHVKKQGEPMTLAEWEAGRAEGRFK